MTKKRQNKSGTAAKRTRGRPAVEIIRTAPEVKLDFGSGQVPREGFEGVDLHAPNAKHRVDLMKLPLPWVDASVDAIHCSHFLEHLPARDVEERDLLSNDGDHLGKDFLFAFMDECHRILKPGGVMSVAVPALQSVRAFQDPTHRRFFPQVTFLYFSKEWRELQRLDHYRTTCNFGVEVVPIVPVPETARAPEVQGQRITELWNVVIDWQAKLVKL